MPIEDMNFSNVWFPVGFDIWEDYVAAFALKLPRLPNQYNRVASFRLPNGDRLDVVSDENSMFVGRHAYVDVPSEELLTIIWESLPTNVRQGRLQSIAITAVKHDRIVYSTIRLGNLKFNRPGLAEKTGGVVHNPPY